MLDTSRINGLGKSGETYLVGSDFYLKSKSRFFPKAVQPIKAETPGVKTAFLSGNGNAVFPDYRKVLCLSSFDKINIANLNLHLIIKRMDYQVSLY